MNWSHTSDSEQIKLLLPPAVLEILVLSRSSSASAALCSTRLPKSVTACVAMLYAPAEGSAGVSCPPFLRKKWSGQLATTVWARIFAMLG